MSKTSSVKEGLGACSHGKILKFEILKLLEMQWNCQSYHHNVLLYHFESFTIPSGRMFLLLKGVHVHLMHPMPTGLYLFSALQFNHTNNFCKFRAL